jgi:hypothetical protein
VPSTDVGAAGVGLVEPAGQLLVEECREGVERVPKVRDTAALGCQDVRSRGGELNRLTRGRIDDLGRLGD